MTECEKDHRYWPTFESLPHDQSGEGRHGCAGCAYELGYAQGVARKETISIELEKLPRSQAGTVRHKSPHAGWAMGYLDGVHKSYRS